MESARLDGAGEFRTFFSVAFKLMTPSLVTIFLFQFVAIWNNFMLPYIMLGDDHLYPVTVGLSGLLNQGASQPAMYTSVVTGALLSIIPLVALFLGLQRYWRVDTIRRTVSVALACVYMFGAPHPTLVGATLIYCAQYLFVFVIGGVQVWGHRPGIPGPLKVIAALVGAGGLGVPVVRALNSVQVGMGFEAGFTIVLLAIILDRISRPKERGDAR